MKIKSKWCNVSICVIHVRSFPSTEYAVEYNNTQQGCHHACHARHARHAQKVSLDLVITCFRVSLAHVGYVHARHPLQRQLK